MTAREWLLDVRTELEGAQGQLMGQIAIRGSLDGALIISIEDFHHAF